MAPETLERLVRSLKVQTLYVKMLGAPFSMFPCQGYFGQLLIGLERLCTTKQKKRQNFEPPADN